MEILMKHDVEERLNKQILDILFYIDTNKFQDEKYISHFIQNAMSVFNINFTLKEINRLQSTLICEMKDSYVQQSQRYVEFDTSNIDEVPELTKKCYDLYNRMTELKDGVTGRPKPSDFKYNIPYEDGRYILPLSSKTNISVSMSGDKIIEFLLYISTNEYTKDIYEMFINKFESLNSLLERLNRHDFDTGKSFDYLKKYYQIGNTSETFILLDYDSEFESAASIGASTSTSKSTGYEMYYGWEEEDRHQKAKGLIDRVMNGSHHEGIAEQVRYTYYCRMSLSAYHQFIRHRLHNIKRESLYDIITKPLINSLREFDEVLPTDIIINAYIPDSIKNSIFFEEYVSLVKEVNSKLNSNDTDLTQLLNCHYVQMFVSTNARADNSIFKERLCLNAQTEIRELTEKRFNELWNNKSTVLFKQGLPPCVLGRCPEGKLSCGKAKDVREKYKFNVTNI